MTMRKITSLTALVSFVFLMLTSIILYIVPAGRVAYWAGYELWGLSKEEWGAVHINLGFLFFIAIILHTYYNWAAIVAYMKNRARQLRVFTPDFNVSLVVTLVVFIGTLLGLPPMSSVINLGAAISEQANQKYGEPPYGHAELSPLSDFADKIKVDLQEGLSLLLAAGIKVSDSKQPVKEIAEANGLTPQAIYLTMKPTAAAKATEMPAEAPAGTGKKTLLQICEMYQLPATQILKGLHDRNISVELNRPLKEVAEANGVDPHMIYAEIYQLVKAGK